MKEGISLYENNYNNNQPVFDLEKAIKKMQKINKEKYLINESREKRKLNIREKRYLPKQTEQNKENDL